MALLIDHLLTAPPAYRVTWLEPITLLAALSGVTRTMRLGTLVLVLPFRDPVLLAKEWATLDVLSGGRTILGVGVGWHKGEFEAVRIPRRERGAGWTSSWTRPRCGAASLRPIEAATTPRGPPDRAPAGPATAPAHLDRGWHAAAERIYEQQVTPFGPSWGGSPATPTPGSRTRRRPPRWSAAIGTSCGGDGSRRSRSPRCRACTRTSCMSSRPARRPIRCAAVPDVLGHGPRLLAVVLPVGRGRAARGAHPGEDRGARRGRRGHPKSARLGRGRSSASRPRSCRSLTWGRRPECTPATSHRPARGRPRGPSGAANRHRRRHRPLPRLRLSPLDEDILDVSAVTDLAATPTTTDW